MAQPLERGLGEWHAEWVPLTESVLLVEGALEQAAVLLEGLEVHPERMAANLAVTGGAIMAEPVARLLTPSLGPERARRWRQTPPNRPGSRGVVTLTCWCRWCWRVVTR